MVVRGRRKMWETLTLAVSAAVHQGIAETVIWEDVTKH